MVSTFISMTQSLNLKQRHGLAIRVTLAILVASFLIYLGGSFVFTAFDITLDAFRVGTGLLLLYSSFTLVHGRKPSKELTEQIHEDDVAVVPLAIPVTVGPATIGALMVFGTDLTSMTQILFGLAGIATAILVVGILLFAATFIEKAIGKRGLSILSKLTGLILSALAAQLILQGIKNFMS